MELSLSVKNSSSSMSSSVLTDIPDEFICPICLDVMEDPVMATDGYTYERKAIEEHFKHSNKSPLGGYRLKNKDLIPNHNLRGRIIEWKEKMKKGNPDPISSTPNPLAPNPNPQRNQQQPITSNTTANNGISILEGYIRKDGYGIQDLIRVGYTIEEIYTAGNYFTLEDFRAAGVSVDQLPSTIPVRDLRRAGYTALEALNGGRKIYDMMEEAGGYKEINLLQTIPLSTLQDLGVPAFVLAKHGKKPDELQKAGYSKKDIAMLVNSDLEGYTPARLNAIDIPKSLLEEVKHHHVVDIDNWWNNCKKKEEEELEANEQRKECFANILFSPCILVFFLGWCCVIWCILCWKALKWDWVGKLWLLYLVITLSLIPVWISSPLTMLWAFLLGLAFLFAVSFIVAGVRFNRDDPPLSPDEWGWLTRAFFFVYAGFLAGGLATLVTS